MATCICCGDWFEGGSAGEKPVCVACRSSFAFPPAKPASAAEPIVPTNPDFDAYYVWLGISPAKQPPNHYQLLGLADLEGNSDVIATSADRQLTHLRAFLSGPQRRDAERLLAEVDAARVCLLNEHAKAAYDQILSDVAQALALSGVNATSSSGRSVPVLTPAMQTVADTCSPAPEPQTSHPPNDLATPLLQDYTMPASRRQAKPRRSPVIQFVQIVVGGIAGCAIGYYLGFVLLPSIRERAADSKAPPQVESVVRP